VRDSGWHFCCSTADRAVNQKIEEDFMRTGVALFFMFIAAVPSFAVAGPTIVNAALHTSYLPDGFDNNDQTEFMVEGTLSNTCYKAGPHDWNIDKASKEITVFSHAYFYNILCLQMVFDYSLPINAGILAAGDYKVKDGASGIALGQFKVNVSKNDGPDDKLYAPVQDATIDRNAGTVTLTGSFKQGCYRFKSIDVTQNSKNVILVTPVIDEENLDCDIGNYAFEEIRPLPKGLKGRNLLHVRVLNGRSISKLFDM